MYRTSQNKATLTRPMVETKKLTPSWKDAQERWLPFLLELHSFYGSFTRETIMTTFFRQGSQYKKCDSSANEPLKPSPPKKRT